MYKVDREEIMDQCQSWYRQFHALRVALKNKKYLLSHYTTELLLYCREIPMPQTEWSDDAGKIESEKLLATCSRIVARQDSAKADKPYYYSDVKEYIRQHPLTFLEDKTKAYLYFLKLGNIFSHWCITYNSIQSKRMAGSYYFLPLLIPTNCMVILSITLTLY